MSDPDTPLLEAIDLGVAIAGRTLLTGVDLRVRSGELVALVGPNGAGKSTLLGVLAGDQPPVAGTVSLGGDDLSSLRPRQRALRRAVLPQQHRVGFAFTVEEVVALGRHPHRDGADGPTVAAALAATGMTALAGRSVLELSGGETTRAALARVLAQDAPLLLLDEPTAALDLRHQRQVLDLCRRLADEGRGVVIVVHDLTLAAEADRVGMVAGGHVAVDRPDAILDADELTRTYGTAVDVLVHPRTGRPVVTLGAG